MTPRTGRPPSDDPRKLTLHVRMNQEELDRLEYCCKATGKARTEIIREGIDKVYKELQNGKQGGKL